MMDALRNALSPEELIAQAREAFPSPDFGDPVESLLEACEAFQLNGFADESCGDVDSFGFYYRVHRWIVEIDSQGFKSISIECDTEREAISEFQKIADEFYGE